MGPILSIVHDSAIAPSWEPDRTSGGGRSLHRMLIDKRIDPQVSEPIENPTRAAAVAAPDPEDDPQLHRPRSQGLLVAPLDDAAAVL